MKKKLVSILLSFSMCASFAMPLTTAAANEAQAEDIVVEETTAPSAKSTWKPESKSPAAISLYAEDGTSKVKLKIAYGDNVRIEKSTSSTKGYNFVYYACTEFEGNPERLVADGNGKNDFKEESFELVNNGDKSYVSVGDDCITAKKITKQAVPVKLEISSPSAGEETASVQLDVTVVEKPLSNENGLNTVNFDPENVENDLFPYDCTKEKSSYKNLADFYKKFKGKNMTVKVSSGLDSENKQIFTDLNLGKDYTVKSIAPAEEAEAYPAGKKIDTANYYTTKRAIGVVSGESYAVLRDQNRVEKITNGAINNLVDITITGKGNYKGDFTFHDQIVKMEPQRLNVGTISGATVTFGSIGVSLFEGMTQDNFTEIAGESDKDKAKNFKFTMDKDTSKCIKIKDGMLTVKSVPEEKKRNAKVTITNKKNPNCTVDVKVNLIPMDISNAAVEVDLSGVTKKNYKNLVEFQQKFFGKNVTKIEDKKGTGLKVGYKDGNDKDVKLKAKKDMYVDAIIDGTISTKKKSSDGKLEPAAYFTADGKVVTTSTIVIKGVGNYTGVITKEAIAIPLEIQVVSGSGDVVTTTFGSAASDAPNVYDFISLDAAAAVLGSGETEIIKNLKVKADKDSGLKVDKDGNITAKSVPSSGKGKIVVSSKKNNTSVDATYTLEVNVDKATVTSAGLYIDTAPISSKKFADKNKAEEALKKLKIKNEAQKALKAGTDYDSITTTKTYEDPDKINYTYTLSAKLKGNYEGTVVESGVDVELVEKKK